MAAFSISFAASLLLSLVLLHLISDTQQMVSMEAYAPSPVAAPAINCTAACGERCGKSKRPNLCKRSCGSCCKTCNCVPPGTSGNYEVCPCYFRLKTHNETRRKCP